MKVVIAIDSFKGCASSNELAQQIKEGILNIYKDPEILICPIADGGEGTVDALKNISETKYISAKCMNPIGEEINADYIILKDKTAVIEMASASGLALISREKRNPSITTSYGTGDLIKDAIKRGVRKFIIGIGGSATNDSGLGMLSSLGYKFYDKLENEIFFAKDMNKISKIDKSNRLKELNDCHFLVACDVNNPLFGENGASYIYGAQKGADKNMIKTLDKNLKHFANIVQKDKNKSFDKESGAGAAGGLGFAFMSFLNSKLKSGIELILEEVELEKQIKDSDFVITGEGKIDKQSSMGKVIDGIATICKKENIPCIALTGNSNESCMNIHEKGITSVFSILNSPLSLEEAMNKENTLISIKEKTEQIFRLIHNIKNKGNK